MNAWSLGSNHLIFWGAMVFFGKKSLFPVSGEKNHLFLILRKKNCLFHPQLPLYVLLKLKEKKLSRKKTIAPPPPPPPPQKIKWLLPYGLMVAMWFYQYHLKSLKMIKVPHSHMYIKKLTMINFYCYYQNIKRNESYLFFSFSFCIIFSLGILRHICKLWSFILNFVISFFCLIKVIWKEWLVNNQ